MDAVEHCTVCWGVCGFASSRQNLDLAKSQEGFTSFYQARDVIAASEQCRMCAFIVTRIKWLFKTISLDSNIATNVRFHKFKGASEEYLSVDTLVIRWNIDGKTLPWVETYGGAQWSILAYRDNPAAAEIQWSPVNYEVGSSAKQAKSWIEQCKLHEHCPEPRVPLLPTRVLEINDESVRLYVNRYERCHYCALSYCWGGPQPVRTLDENIEGHKSGIRISVLPQTLQDAINFTRQLGIKYLWVDSLCIVQDSVDDKRREIARMASIYQNALVTIAATNISCCTEGFLSTRCKPSREILIGDLPWSCEDGSSGKVSLHCQDLYSADQEPLNKRAWTLQERLLSPRVLSFSSQQLVWECQTARYTDGGNPGSRYNVGTNRLESYIFSPLTTAMIERSPQAIYIHYTWIEAVMDLSRRKITEESDKLPAISGVAQRMHLITGDDYLAGLWRASLHFELLWCQDPSADDFHHARRPKEYRAPSWSWASVEGTVGFGGPFERESMVAKVIQCDVLPVDPSNPFGAVSSGHLVIRGPLRSLDANSILDHFHINSTDAREASLARMFLDGDEVLPSFTAVPLSNDELESSSVDQRIWLLYMARNKHGDIFGLVLRSVHQRNDRVFRRIGWFDPSSGSSGTAFWTLDIPVDTITIV